MVESDNVPVFGDDCVNIRRECDGLHLPLIGRKRCNSFAIRLRASPDTKERKRRCIVRPCAVLVVVRRAYRHDRILEVVLPIVIGDFNCPRSILLRGKGSLDGRDGRPALTENLCHCTGTIYDNAIVPTVRDNDGMTDVRRLLCSGHAFLRGIEDGVKAEARLFFPVLIKDFFIRIGCSRYPFLPVCA